MKVLIFGGTGAIGSYVAQLLSQRGVFVTVTTRTHKKDVDYIKYVVGNAKDDHFLTDVLKQRWDAILDFMVYSTKDLSERIDLLLSSTDQYVFISSARVYADSPQEKINEDSARLLDVCEDEEYLKTDEYALTKARQENILLNSRKKNWTIIRPSLTYSENRLQLGVYEKENWLYRALKGRSIVFSKDLMDRYYTLSYGRDVSTGIADLIGKKDAIGEVFHIVVEKSYKWCEILEIYLAELEKKTGMRPKVILTEKSTNLQIASAKYQVIYGRYFNRHFDNSKIRKVVDTSKWLRAEEGLPMCLSAFLDNPKFLDIDWIKEAYIDRAAHEWTPLSEIPGKIEKIRYLLYRLGIKGAR